jgi:cytochrome subunit of sulfide dehydrogenase
MSAVRHVALAFVAALALSPSRGAFPAEPGSSAYLAATCAACHLPHGGGKAIPSLAGRDEQSLASAMLAFRSAARPSQIMHAVAGALSEDEIAMVAHALATEAKEAKRR